MRRIHPASSANKISARDGSPTEFEVQAFLYSALQGMGANVRGELVFYSKSRKDKCRFDLVVFDDKNNPLEILEVKAAPVNHKTCLEDTRQYQKYVHFGVDVVFIYGMDDARDYLSQCNHGKGNWDQTDWRETAR